MHADVDSYLEELDLWLSRRDSLAVAFSGGVDSSLVLAASVRRLGGDAVVAITGESETMPAAELSLARELAEMLGTRHEVIRTHELENRKFSANPPDRCYFCKQEFWRRAGEVVAGHGIESLADGTNTDDVSGHRPGVAACDEAGVLHPLVDIGAGKQMVRSMARSLDLPNWDKPAQACLSSRFPYGTHITPEGLRRVEAAEAFLEKLGLGQLRVRDHDGLARIEVPAADLENLAAGGKRERITARFRELGYDYVTLDLEGFRSGSMNEVLGGEEGN